MKKIFAFILASIMVLSLVPASAFAAITKEEACPDVHTVANCVEKVVYSKPATCGENGYTVYECTKCGEQFIGNVVAAGEHVWVSDPDLADEDVEINCKEPKTYTVEGETVVAVGVLNEKCAECNATRKNYVTEAKYHEENGVWVSGVGCEATYTCPVCEDTFNSKGGEVGVHAEWKLVEVLVKPVYTAGTKTPGLALFACANEDCQATKKVTIEAECDCASVLSGTNGQVNFFKRILAGQIVKSGNAKDPSCTADGKFAVYKCTACSAQYRWQTTNVLKPTVAPELAENENGAEIVKGGSFVKITSTASDKYVVYLEATSSGKLQAKADKTDDTSTKKYIMIKKVGHVADGDPLSQNKCTFTYKCKVCKTTYTKTTHDWLTTAERKPTCEQYGIIYKSCKRCGETSSDVKNPLGHDIKTATVPSTCGTYGYTFTYCAHNVKNDNTGVAADEFQCSYYDKTNNPNVGKNNDDNANKVPYTDPTTGITYPDVRVGKKAYPIVSITPNTSYLGSHKMVIVDVIGGNTGYCNASSIVVEKCQTCGIIEYEQVAGADHELVIDKNLSVDATCAAEGKIVKKCKNCDYIDVTFTAKLVGTHTTEKVVIGYVCAKDTAVKFKIASSSVGYLNIRETPEITEDNIVGTIPSETEVEILAISDDTNWYKISYNNVTGWASKSGFVATTYDVNFYQNPKDGQYYHGIRTVVCPCGEYTGEIEYFDKVGATNTAVWFDDLDEAKAYHGTGLGTPVTTQKPSCDTNGYEIYQCSKCSAAVYVIKPAEGHEAGNKITGTAAKCNAAGIADYYTCSKCFASIILKDGKYVKVTASELVLQPHSQATVPVYVEACDGTKTTYYQCQQKDSNGNICGKYFEDKAATKPIDKLPEGNVHNWETLYAGVTLTCNTDGYPTIKYCATCKTLERTQLVEVLENGKVVVKSGKDLLPAKYDHYLSITAEEYEIPLHVKHVNGVIDVSGYKVPKLSHGEAHKDNVPYYSDTVWANIFNHAYDVKTVICGEQDAYTIHKCLLCEYEYITGYVAAGEGHYNVYGELLEATCANYTLYSERRCVVCNTMVGADASIHNMAVKSEEDAEKYIEVDATCVSEGYVFNYCTNDGCLFVEVVSTEPIKDAETFHADPANIKASNPKNYAMNGDTVYTCKYCGEIVKVELASEYNLPAGFEIFLDTEFDSYAIGSTIDVVVSLDSLKGVDVWAFNFAVTYPAAYLEYVGAEFTSITGFTGIDPYNDVQYITERDMFDEDMDGDTTDTIQRLVKSQVNVVVTSTEGVEIKGAQELMVLSFKVKALPPFNPTVSFASVAGEKAASAPNGTVVPCNYSAIWNTCSVSLKSLFDLNNDGEFNVLDAYELYSLIVLGGYDVAGDVNGNGANDAQDLDYLYRVLIGELTAEEVINPKTEEERTYKYDEDGTLIYDSYCDFNKNGVIDTNSEWAAFTGRIDPATIWESLK